MQSKRNDCEISVADGINLINLSLGTISKIEKALGVDLIHIERPYARVETSTSWSDFSQSCA